MSYTLTQAGREKWVLENESFDQINKMTTRDWAYEQLCMWMEGFDVITLKDMMYDFSLCPFDGSPRPESHQLITSEPDIILQECVNQGWIKKQ